MAEKALTKPSRGSLIEIDKHVAGGGQALAGALAALGVSIDGMSPDDVVLEIHSERDGNKALSHIRLRAYRHKPKD